MSFVESYDFLLTIQHITLGQIDIWKSKEEGSLVYCKILEGDYPKDQLSQRSDWDNENVVELLAAELHKSNAKCYIAAYFEFYGNTLQEYLYECKTALVESECWNIFYQIVNGLHFLGMNGQQSNLVSTNIFYNKGQIKLIEGNSMNLIQQIGLVLFEICSRESENIIIDEQRILYDNLEVILSEMNYSNILIKLLRELLSEDSKASVDQLYELLNPYQEQIRKQIPFKINNPLNNRRMRMQRAIRSYQDVLERIQQQ